MRTLAEVLAGCPGERTGEKQPASWGSPAGLPGFMLRRLFIVLTRPTRAIGEFGAEDWRTPLLFFLSFTLILTFLSYLDPVLRDILFTMTAVPGASPGTAVGVLAASGPLLISSTVERCIINCLLFGIETGILVVLLRVAAHHHDWRTSLAISAYCSPLFPLPDLLIEYATLPLGYFHPSELWHEIGWVYGAGLILGILMVTIVAGYGIVSLVHTPPARTLMILAGWIIVGAIVTWGVQDLLIMPLEGLAGDYISRVFFPINFPAAGANTP